MINKIYTFSVAVVISLFAFACKNSDSNLVKEQEFEVNVTEKTLMGEENTTVAFLAVEGMSCEVGCARFINGKLSKLEGVIASEVIFEENLARVSFDPAKISGKELANYVNELNEGQYQVKKVEIEKTVKKEVSLEESNAVKSSSNEQIEKVNVESFKSISFPNVFNIFKLKIG